MIAFTIDVDWANEIILEETISIFDKYSAKCTFFSTHHSKILAECDKKQFEIAIHPDFTPAYDSASGKTIEDIIDDLLKLNPDAQGVRSHLLHNSTKISQKFADKKLVYEANQFTPYQKGLKPYKLWNGMVSIPYNWEDEIHWTYGHNFDSSAIDLKQEGLNIFDFHPVNIFLNTENKYRYNAAKKYFDEPLSLKRFRNTEINGTYNLLISLLDYCREYSIETKKQIEIAQDFLKKSSAI